MSFCTQANNKFDFLSEMEVLQKKCHDTKLEEQKAVEKVLQIEVKTVVQQAGDEVIEIAVYKVVYKVLPKSAAKKCRQKVPPKSAAKKCRQKVPPKSAAKKCRQKVPPKIDIPLCGLCPSYHRLVLSKCLSVSN
jgi:hypothetical protein